MTQESFKFKLCNGQKISYNNEIHLHYDETGIYHIRTFSLSQTWK